jgi:hypothetical protein
MWECPDGRQMFQGDKETGYEAEGASDEERFSLILETWKKYDYDCHVSTARQRRNEHLRRHHLQYGTINWENFLVIILYLYSFGAGIYPLQPLLASTFHSASCSSYCSFSHVTIYSFSLTISQSSRRIKI